MEKALVVSQIILWDDGKYTAHHTAVDTKNVPFGSYECYGNATRKNEEEMKQELLDMHQSILSHMTSK